MEKRGLCNGCINDRWCTFPRKFPVSQCEEFTGYEPKPERTGKTKPEEIKSDGEQTVGK